MANYQKTTWATGDVVTSTKLNNMESGIARLYQVEYTEAGIALSFNDLKALLQAGCVPYIVEVLEDDKELDLYVFNGSHYDSDNSKYVAQFAITGASGASFDFEAADADTAMSWSQP